MEDIKKSIEKLLRRRKKSQIKINPSLVVNSTLSSYVFMGSCVPQLRSRVKNINSLYNQNQQNVRLFKKLSQIKQRHNTFDNSSDQKFSNKVYQLNIASRKLQRQMREKNIQHQNSQFIDRIVKIREHRSSFFEGSLQKKREKSLDQSRQRGRKRSNKSVLLPPIDK